jgi:P4 family phage/plasmid primase-like protien
LPALRQKPLGSLVCPVPRRARVPSEVAPGSHQCGCRVNLSELLEALGYAPGEFLSIGIEPVGETFRTKVIAYAPEAIEAIVENAATANQNTWFGINPMRGPARENAGRGTILDVTRLAAVWADLDVKPGGCQSYEVANAIIGELSAILGTEPSVVVNSGHGLQPYWPIEHAPISDGDGSGRAKAVALLRRFGRLAATVAQALNADVDSVFDLTRIMRMPGGVNRKDPANPVPATAERRSGGPITLQRLADALDEFGISEQPDDAKIKTRAVDRTHADYLAVADWTASAYDCGYIKTVIDGWASDVPDGKGRHPWHLAQATRVSAAHRNGCLSPEGLAHAYRALGQRFTELCVNGIGGTPRKVRPAELGEAIAFGNSRAVTMSDADVASELGRHLHLGERIELGRQGPVIGGQRPGPIASEANSHPMPPVSVKWPASVAGLQPPAQATGTDGPVAEPAPVLASVTPIRPNVDGETKPATNTDSGNTDLMVVLHRDRLRYCPEAGAWLTWDGARWQMGVDESAAFSAARASIDAITIGDEHRDRHITRSLSRNALGAMVTLGRWHRDMRVSLDRLDAYPYELNTPSGVLDLKTGTLHDPDPNRWHTKTTGVGYDAAMPATEWLKFLNTTFGGDADLIGYAQRVAGLAAIGQVLQHILPFLFGAGQNGKSVFLDVLVGVLGEYAITAPAGFLLDGRDKHETEIARLRGARLVVCSEINEHSKFDEAKVKALTGGDVLSGRFMRQNFFDFIPSHTLMLMGNHQPQVSAGGTSFWRRLRLIPFHHRVPDDQKVSGLDKMLADDEGPAILAWIASGAREVINSGLCEPASVTRATAGYASEEDVLGRFMTECCDVGDDLTDGERPTVLLNAFVAWARANGEDDRLTATKLGREMPSRYGRKSATGNNSGSRVYPGVRIKANMRPTWMPTT